MVIYCLFGYVEYVLRSMLYDTICLEHIKGWTLLYTWRRASFISSGYFKQMAVPCFHTTRYRATPVVSPGTIYFMLKMCVFVESHLQKIDSNCDARMFLWVFIHGLSLLHCHTKNCDMNNENLWYGES